MSARHGRNKQSLYRYASLRQSLLLQLHALLPLQGDKSIRLRPCGTQPNRCVPRPNDEHAYLVKQYVKDIVRNVVPVGRRHDHVRCLRKELDVLPRVGLDVVQELLKPLPRLAAADGIYVLR